MAWFVGHAFVLCGIPCILAGVSAGYYKSTIVPITFNQGPSWKNWHGPHQVMTEMHSRVLLCVISESSPELESQRRICLAKTLCSIHTYIHELKDSWGLNWDIPVFNHHKTNRLVKWFNQIFKNIVCKFAHLNAYNWDKWLWNYPTVYPDTSKT